MILHNINSKQKDSGFTIVELLVVIVVIGILAAITIVSYAGVTARANGSKALSNAQTIVSVAEAINADNSNYPTTTATAGTGFSTMTSTARIPTGITLLIGANNPTSANGTTNFRVLSLTAAPTTGGKVIFWDYSTQALCSDKASPDNCLYWGAANATNNSGTTGVTAFAS
jgi:prepilin-type N-terminal cleavage/methylation domain-containing protein